MPIFTLDIFGFILAPTWYGFMYAVSFAIGLMLMRQQYDEKNTDTIFIATVLGVILWGRLGYVFFYNFSYFLDHPIEILMPWKWGMSFHGGVIGVVIAWFFSARKIHIPFFKLVDSLVWIMPIGLFFGRIGNFINWELLGLAGYSWPFARIVDGVAYFPTPLFEAFFEGIILFLILFFKRKKIQYPGQLGVWFLFWYSVFRFFAEFFRDPDPQIGYILGGWMTMGHLFSIIFIWVAFVLWIALKRKKPLTSK